MAFIAQSRRNKFWFGTEQKMSFFPTPNRGADVSPAGWEAGGLLLNGGGYQLNSFGSHKNYMFEWPSSSAREVAQKMKSYADGTYGRGLIYFLDPLTWTTNVLPAMWADPSMGVGYEGASLVYGVEATGLPTSGGDDNELPVTSAYYDLSTVAAGWRGKEDAVFIPIPEGYTLALGSIHAQSGTGRVFYREQATNGALGAITALTPIAAGAGQIVNTFVSGASLAGIWLYIGKTSAGAGSVTLTAMTGRIIESAKTQSTFIARNEFTNPNLVGDGTWAEVRRNYLMRPNLSMSTNGWSANAAMPLSSGSTGGVLEASSDVAAGAGLLWANTNIRVDVTPGEVLSLAGAFTSSTPLSLSLEVTWYASGSAATTESVDFTSTSSQVVVKLEGVVVPAGIDSARYALRAKQDIPAGAVIGIADGMSIEKFATSIGLFSGSSIQGSIDPDMRQRWLGAENASESVMEIERVRGLVAVRGVAGVSAWEGKPAARLIPTDDTGNGAYFQPVGTRPLDGTFTATVNLKAPLTNIGSSINGRRVYHSSPVQYGPQAPNEAGSFESRVHYSGTGALIAHNGNRLGGGDVWWTDIGLFAGDYDGPVFSGDSSGLVINGRNVRTQWDGTPNNSTSSAWTTTPALDALQQGPWVGGQGHSGCRFIGKPTYMNNTGVEGGQVSFAASFREVGFWNHG